MDGAIVTASLTGLPNLRAVWRYGSAYECTDSDVDLAVPADHALAFDERSRATNVKRRPRRHG